MIGVSGMARKTTFNDRSFWNGKKNYFSIFICFSLPWIAYFFWLYLSKEIIFNERDMNSLKRTQNYIFLLNFIPSIVFFGFGIVINILIDNFKDDGKMKLFFKVIIVIGALIIMDQTIQFLIVKQHGLIYIPIVKDWLAIKPLFVIQSGDEFDSMGQQIFQYRILTLFSAGLIQIIVLRFLLNFYLTKSHLYVAITFFAAGSVCAFLNTLLYKNGYDYIDIQPYIVFDIKDIYIYLGLALFFQSIIIKANYEVLKNATWKDVWKFFVDEYWNIKNMTKNLVNKRKK
jgi:hypothetical protein